MGPQRLLLFAAPRLARHRREELHRRARRADPHPRVEVTEDGVGRRPRVQPAQLAGVRLVLGREDERRVSAGGGDGLCVRGFERGDASLEDDIVVGEEDEGGVGGSRSGGGTRAAAGVLRPDGTSTASSGRRRATRPRPSRGRWGAARGAAPCRGNRRGTGWGDRRRRGGRRRRRAPRSARPPRRIRGAAAAARGGARRRRRRVEVRVVGGGRVLAALEPRPPTPRRRARRAPVYSGLDRVEAHELEARRRRKVAAARLAPRGSWCAGGARRTARRRSRRAPRQSARRQRRARAARLPRGGRACSARAPPAPTRRRRPWTSRGRARRCRRAS